MVEDKDSRVDFGMAEALAFGTLALHRGVRPPQAPQNACQSPGTSLEQRTREQRGEYLLCGHGRAPCTCATFLAVPAGS